MGDIAEMIICGILCEQCGVFIDCVDVGHPRLCDSCNYYFDKTTHTDSNLK